MADHCVPGRPHVCGSRRPRLDSAPRLFVTWPPLINAQRGTAVYQQQLLSSRFASLKRKIVPPNEIPSCTTTNTAACWVQYVCVTTRTDVCSILSYYAEGVGLRHAEQREKKFTSVNWSPTHFTRELHTKKTEARMTSRRKLLNKTWEAFTGLY